jgi:hypothetical protein
MVGAEQKGGAESNDDKGATHQGLLLEGERGSAEGVALAVAQLALLCAPSQDIIDVLRITARMLLTV